MPSQEPVFRDVRIDPHDQTNAQKALHDLRSPTLDADSHADFVAGFKKLQKLGLRGPKITRRAEGLMAASGVAPSGATPLSHVEAFKVMIQDPYYAAQVRLERSCQHLMWDRARRAFHANAAYYLAAMAATDDAGPGHLELDPQLNIPDYARHEIHTQPGGYVGDPLAGWVYHHAVTLAFAQGRNEFEAGYLAVAQSHPVPAAGRLARIIDLGCGTGQSTTALKERFPDAEVWGIDVAGPMVRYAHHRAVKMGIPVNFAQRLAEATRFESGFFDMVTDHLLFHEVSPDAAPQIVREIFRILRPGGVFSHIDVLTEGHPAGRPDQSLPGKAWTWVNHRHNVEPWWLAYESTDFPALLRQAGFSVDFTGANGSPLGPRVIATKPATAV